jgi:hypothetical protein
MAWVLPASAFSASYARDLLAELSLRFGRVMLISVKQRMFLSGGAEEASQLLLCEDFGAPIKAKCVEYCECADVNECANIFESIRSGHTKFPSFSDADSATVAKLSSDECDAWMLWQHFSGFVRLGDLARLFIGLVTGANGFFVMNRETADSHELPSISLAPVLAKIDTAPGIVLTKGDLRLAQKKGHRCLLLNCNDQTVPNAAVKKYSRFWPAHRRKQNVTFAKRSNWLAPDDGRVPDAFLPYMNHEGPRLILNRARVNCTNTIHRVSFMPEVPMSLRRWAAISMLSTFSQLGAELVGRSYGGGILKHEIGEAAAIPLIIPPDGFLTDATSVFQRIDSACRRGDYATARFTADEGVAMVVGEALASHISTFCRALDRLRMRRWPSKTI